MQYLSLNWQQTTTDAVALTSCFHARQGPTVSP